MIYRRKAAGLARIRTRAEEMRRIVRRAGMKVSYEEMCDLVTD